MIPWFLSDPARLSSEDADLHRLVTSVDWLSVAEWTLAGPNLVVDFEIRVHGFNYALRLEYPPLFPSVPAVVRPRAADERLSAHQYGPGGPLCLQWRPDNWTPEVTGAQLIESAYRLLYTENPSGVAAGGRGGTVESAHSLTLGQELRTSARLRLFVPSDAQQSLSGHTTAERGEATLALRSHRDASVVFIRSVHLGANEYTPSLPSDRALGASALSARVLTTQLSATDVKATKHVSAFGPHVTEEDRLADWLLVISSEATVHLLLKLTDGELYAADSVLQDSADGQRTPTQYESLAQRSVAIIGAGSLGTKIATSLARMGVRRFLLIDDDILFPENLQRSALDWVAVADHKASATAEAIERIAPNARVEDRRVRLTGQESSATIATLVAKISECDAIIDVTANPSNFNIVAAAAISARKPLLWAEVYGGGKGGVILRSAPDADPPPHVVRLAYLKYCEAHPGPRVEASNYELQLGAGPALRASDADVAIIAHHAVRIAADALVNPTLEHQYPIYLIGLSRWWVFTAPFDTLPLAIPRETWPTPPEESHQEMEQGLAIVRKVLDKLTNDPTPS